MAHHAIRSSRSNGDRLTFKLFRVLRDGKSTEAAITTLKLIVGPGDEGEPIVTILLLTKTEQAGFPVPFPGRLG